MALVGLGVVGFFLGRSADRRIAASNGWLKGKGLAQAGKILGAIQIACWSLVIVVSVLGAIGSAIQDAHDRQAQEQQDRRNQQAHEELLAEFNAKQAAEDAELSSIAHQVASHRWIDSYGNSTSLTSPECWSITDTDDFQCRVTAYGDRSDFVIGGTVGSEGDITLQQFKMVSEAATEAAAPTPSAGDDCFDEAAFLDAISDYSDLHGSDLADYVTSEVIVAIGADCAAGTAWGETSLDDPTVIYLDRIDGVWAIQGMEADG